MKKISYYHRKKLGLNITMEHIQEKNKLLALAHNCRIAVSKEFRLF